MNNTVLARSLLLSTVAISLLVYMLAGWLASVSEYSKDDMMTIKILFWYPLFRLFYPTLHIYIECIPSYEPPSLLLVLFSLAANSFPAAAMTGSSITSSVLVTLPSLSLPLTRVESFLA